MFANPHTLSWPVPTMGSLAKPPGAFQDATRSVLTADHPVRQEAPNSARYSVRQSIGSLVKEFAQAPVVTASPHTIIDTMRLPVFVVNEHVSPLPRDPEVQPLASVLEEIKALTGLSKTRIAKDLLGVSRTAYHHWSTGKRVSIENERRVRGALDVLQRAAARYGDPALLRGWLVTQVGSRSVAPVDLLKAGMIDEARLLAMSTLPTRETSLPEWLLAAPVDQWSEREQKRRDFVVRESSAISRAVDDD